MKGNDSRFPRRAFWLAGWLVLAFAVSSCSPRQSASGGKAGPGDGPAVPVLVAVAEARDIPVILRAIGTVQAYSTVAIRSQLTGKIESVHFEEGQEVAAGDLLFALDARPWQAALNQAQANLHRDEAQLVSARLEFERTQKLYENKIASQQDYDTAEASYQAMVATVLADGAAVTNAQVNLSYTEIRSPIAGYTGNLVVKAGNVVKSPDDVLVTVTQDRPIYTAFSVPENYLPAIRRQFGSATLSVLAYLPGQTNNAVAGRLTFINNTVDINTGTILLKATYPNEDRVLWPGQFVQVSVTLSNLVNATVVPSHAVQTGQQGEFAFVVGSDHTVSARSVVTGITEDGDTVIQSGIQPGETVVTDGQLRLVPGSKVIVKTGLLTSAVADTNAPAQAR